METNITNLSQLSLKLDSSCDVLKRALPDNDLVKAALSEILAVGNILKESTCSNTNEEEDNSNIVAVFADISLLNDTDAKMFRGGYVLNNVHRVDDYFGDSDLAPISKYLERNG
jgi:hypothetical protein